MISYIKEIKGKKEYRQYFSNKLNNLIKINDIKEANLIVSRQDWELWGKEVDEGYKKILKVEFEENLDGGFILIDLNNNLKYDFSIENIIDENREKNRRKIICYAIGGGKMEGSAGRVVYVNGPVVKAKNMKNFKMREMVTVGEKS